MRNLHSDIADMFSALDGYDRLEDAIARWCAFVAQADRGRRRDEWRRRSGTEAYRKYHREYAAQRYKTDAGFRSRRLDAMVRYKDRKLGADRKRRPLGPLALRHGTCYGFKQGCRLACCRAAMAAYQKARRARMKAAP